jgi:hypothetical protein
MTLWMIHLIDKDTTNNPPDDKDTTNKTPDW